MSIAAVASASENIQNLDRNDQEPRGKTLRHQVKGFPVRIAKAQALRIPKCDHPP